MTGEPGHENLHYMRSALHELLSMVEERDDGTSPVTSLSGTTDELRDAAGQLFHEELRGRMPQSGDGLNEFVMGVLVGVRSLQIAMADADTNEGPNAS